ncbi:hypothetical protein BH11ACT8_BH11ACT8_03770 [soil metagenome]
MSGPRLASATSVGRRCSRPSSGTVLGLVLRTMLLDIKQRAERTAEPTGPLMSVPG